MSTIRTFSGRDVDPLLLYVADVCLEDIAAGLAGTGRAGGHFSLDGELVYYSTAEHCWRMSLAAPPALKPWCIMHDAAEAYLGDALTPIKGALGFMTERDEGMGAPAPDAHFESFREAEFRALSVIADAFALPWPPPPMVKTFDAVAWDIEAETLQKGSPVAAMDDADILPAATTFATRFRRHLEAVPPGLAPGEAYARFLQEARHVLTAWAHARTRAESARQHGKADAAPADYMREYLEDPGGYPPASTPAPVAAANSPDDVDALMPYRRRTVYDLDTPAADVTDGADADPLLASPDIDWAASRMLSLANGRPMIITHPETTEDSP